MRKLYFLTSIFIIILDQATKFLVMKTLTPHAAVDVLPFFRLVYVTNTGAAFGSFQFLGNTFFIIVSFIAIGVVALLMLLGKENLLGFSFILGGAAGNLTDRLRFGYVIDFLDVYAGRYHWPAFNVADSFISVGIVLMLFTYFLFPHKKK